MAKNYFPEVPNMVAACQNVSLGAEVYEEIAFDMRDTERAKSIFANPGTGDTYTRFGNPTNRRLEETFAYMDGGNSALAVTSGTAANFALLNMLLGADGELIASRHLFGGTYGTFNEFFRDNGHTTHWCDPRDADSIEEKITDKTRAIFIETISNADNVIPDFDGIKKVAVKYNIPLVIDNTLATPLLFQPIAYGADFVTYSASKYPGGDNKTLGGIIVSADNFNFVGDTRYEHISRLAVQTGVADPGMAKLRKNVAAAIGATMFSQTAYHIAHRMGSMPERLYKQQDSALAIAEFLQAKEEVLSVRFAGLESDPDHGRMKKYLRGPGSIILVDFGSLEKAARFADNTGFGVKVHVGQEETLNTHSGSTTHRQFAANEQQIIGVGPGTVRLSVGTEDKSGLLKSCDKALRCLYS